MLRFSGDQILGCIYLCFCLLQIFWYGLLFWFLFVEFINFMTMLCFWLTLQMWVYIMISVRPTCQPAECLYVAKTLTLYFLGHNKFDKCRTLHDGCTHWALPIHTTFGELDCILNSFNWKCYVCTQLSWNFIQLLIMSTKISHGRNATRTIQLLKKKV